MEYTFLHKPEPRKFRYKPQFFVPEEEKPLKLDSVNYDPDKFREKLTSSWDRKRHHHKNKPSNYRGFLWMLFLIILLGIIAWKFVF